MTEENWTLQGFLSVGRKLQCPKFLEGNLGSSFLIKEMPKECSFLEAPE